ncbi:adenine deaminase [Denitrovibrio acetiphilus DSM 12809]|uniref:Adenine deaminase n=1 Tax=Denitrovibrio acetiphilus (strain DSM 12809 / NBRC 114555 / N2460) TaxID=522772 RepID=D4H504_DENA2|nr:adenine deaminase [Denitrovibrio acetiphilus]ADD69360.1 adenine deaminase [Denitrovibrio acetiphilus DSM 12809]
MQISGNIVDVKNKETYSGTITFDNGIITEITKERRRYKNYILPPFIDSHVHVESSMLVPTEFARLASVHGTGASVSDPHEICNVLGADGVRFMVENGEETPFRFYFGAPSCVPATPFETAGGEITVGDIRELFKDDRIKYLSEMMNVPGVLGDSETIKEKIKAALDAGRVVDGHAPMLSGADLVRYIAAGITTDHEAVSYAEGEEKISHGMKIQVREGSAAKNFAELSPLMWKYSKMCMLCSDDIHPDDLVEGHINLLVKKAISLGVDPMNVLTSACLTPVEHYGLDCGLLRVGDSADMILVDSLDENMNVLETYIKGTLCAKDGKPLLNSVQTEPVNRFDASAKQASDFASDEKSMADVITVTDGRLITGRIRAVPADNDDILKITVVNRYKDKAPAVGYIKNFGLQRGAIASSVAHDSHNIICVGCDDKSIAEAVNIIISNKGGLAVVDGADRMELPLPVAGLMTDTDGYETAETYRKLDSKVKDMGTKLRAPFMTLSFMALLVIPALKISDKGVFDVERFSFL